MSIHRAACGITLMNEMKFEEMSLSFEMTEKAIGVNYSEVGVAEEKYSVMVWTREEDTGDQVWQITRVLGGEYYLSERVGGGLRVLERSKESCKDRDVWRTLS